MSFTNIHSDYQSSCPVRDNDDNYDDNDSKSTTLSPKSRNSCSSSSSSIRCSPLHTSVCRRTDFIRTMTAIVSSTSLSLLQLTSWIPTRANAIEQQQQQVSVSEKIEITPTGDVKKLFNEGRAYESQGNILAAQRLYIKVTQIAPQFVYGHSNLGNTQTVVGDLINAEQSYTTAIGLCTRLEQQQKIQQQQQQQRQLIANGGSDGSTIKPCPDLYVLLLNRGCIRLNTGRYKEALIDLQQSNQLRARPDSIVLQNLARAQEINGLYDNANTNYDIAIQMTANEVVPYWLRSALVKYQLNDVKGGYDIVQRVYNRFPDAPEVKAMYAIFLWKRGDGGDNNDAKIKAQQLFLQIPDKQRLKFIDPIYLTQTIQWPPKVIDTLSQLTMAVGDKK